MSDKNFNKKLSIVERTIYNHNLIFKAFAIELEWYRSLGLADDERAPQIMLFVIENNVIKSTKLVERELVDKYKPNNNEYYLDRIRDSGDVITDYNLATVFKLVNTFNNIW